MFSESNRSGSVFAEHIGCSRPAKLRTQVEKGKEEISTLDLMESGSSVVGTVTPLKGSAMTISNGYYVGAAIKLSAFAQHHSNPIATQLPAASFKSLYPKRPHSASIKPTGENGRSRYSTRTCED